MSFKYVQNHYCVPACTGRRVIVDGKPGIIIQDCGHHIGVNFDDDKPGVVSLCHPTWKAEYLGLGKIRRQTKSQERYQRWLEYSDGFNSFRDFLAWDCDPERSWNEGRAG